MAMYEVVATDARPGDAEGRSPAAGPCTLFAVRHGTTTYNVQNRYRGRMDVPLDAQGYQDAVDAARALSDAGLAAVYSSPLRRAITTAQIIADEARVPDVRILPALTIVDYGAWTGLTPAEAEAFDPEKFQSYKTRPSRAVCPNGERLTDAADRMMEALALIGRRHGGETVVAVTHAVMIRLAVARIEEIDDERWRMPVGRGSMTQLSLDGAGPRMVARPEGEDVD